MLDQRINELRIASGWSQVQLAEKLNISKQTVSNWENGNIQPSIDALILLAKLFHTSTDYLLVLNNTVTINADVLPISFVAHMTQIIEDYNQK